jgi:hypothetical protein
VDTGGREESGPDRLPAAVYWGFLSTFGRIRDRSYLEAGELPEDRAACPARSNKLLLEPGRPFRRVYLRAAQAYMLISMPTGTSTIFGVFQLIRVSPKQCWHDIRAGIKTRLASNIAQARNIPRQGIPSHLTPETSLLDKATSLLDKASERKRRIDA